MLAHCAEQHGLAIMARMATHIHVFFFVSKARIWPLTGCHESNMCFLRYHGHFFLNCKLVHSPILLSFHIFGTMIKISTRVEIQYKEEKPDGHLCPATLASSCLTCTATHGHFEFALPSPPLAPSQPAMAIHQRQHALPCGILHAMLCSALFCSHCLI